jgi:hypothetical protein
MRLDKNNIFTFYPLGSPCKIVGDSGAAIYGRYVGNSRKGSSIGDIHSIILVSTPCNSFLSVGRAYVLFDLTDDDFKKLKEFEEDAVLHGEWYHKNNSPSELSKYGEFMDWKDIEGKMAIGFNHRETNKKNEIKKVWKVKLFSMEANFLSA